MYKSNNIFILLFILYFLAQGGIFFITGAKFWDDWPFFTGSINHILLYTKEMGSVFSLSGLMALSVSHLGVYFHKSLVFVIFFSVAYFLNDILKKYNHVLDSQTRYLILLFFLLLPFNMARILLATYAYTFSYFLFFFAWYLMRKNQVFSLILFFVSFTLNSLLVFYVIPMLEIFHSEGGLKTFKNFLFCVRRKIIFLALPFFYYFIKFYFFKPYGVYEGYNTGFSFRVLFDSIIPFLKNFSCVPMRGKAIETFILAALISPIVIFVLNKFNLKLIYKKNPSNKILLYLGFFCFFAASFPYLILGHVHNFETWNSRHQILMPLGFSLFLVGIFNAPWTYLNRGQREYQIKFALIVFLISTSIAFQIHFYFKAFIDFKKQSYQVHLISENNIIKNANLIIFNDETIHQEFFENLYKRQVETYEWNSMMLDAFDDNNESRYGISSSRAYYFENYFIQRPDQSSLALERASTHKYDLNNMTLVSFKSYPNIKYFDCLFYGMSKCIFMNVNHYSLK